MAGLPKWLGLLIAVGLVMVVTVGWNSTNVNLSMLDVSTSEDADGSMGDDSGALTQNAPNDEKIVLEADTAHPVPRATRVPGHSPPPPPGRIAQTQSVGTTQRPVANFPASIADYKHPRGQCGKSEPRAPLSYNRTIVNGTRLWPDFPDLREDYGTEHERCHAVMVRMLMIVSIIMRELKLTQWFISHGTLLGAVRNGGFIPWDNDIDIVMPRSHITLLRKRWRPEFPRDMFLQTEKTEPTFHMWTGRERAMRVKDRYSSYAGQKYTMWKRGKRYKMKKWHQGAQIDIIPLEKKSKGKSHKILHHFFNSSLIFPTSTVCFENIELPAPANVHEVLRLLYGDEYMQTPKNATMESPHPCMATEPSRGSGWSLNWKEDHPGGGIPPKVTPRQDPHGSAKEDYKVPYTLFFNNKF